MSGLDCLTASSSKRIVRSCPRSHSENPLCHYIIVRADLPRGLQSAMIVHAAGESVPETVPEGTYAVVLAVANERALVRAADNLRRRGVAYHLVFEEDEAMAIGLRPGRKEELRRHVSQFALLK